MSEMIPTPVQCRLLKSLHAMGGDVSVNKLERANSGLVSRSTYEACIRRGWIQWKPFVPNATRPSIADEPAHYHLTVDGERAMWRATQPAPTPATRSSDNSHSTKGLGGSTDG